MQDREAARSARPSAPDAGLVALVRLLARHAARQDHTQALREGTDSGNAGESPSENAP
jgi:hypothetical protein